MASNYKNLLFEKTDTYSISNDSAFDTKLNDSVYSGIIEDKPIFHSSQEHLHKLVPPTLITKTKLSPNSSISSINSSKISLPESKIVKQNFDNCDSKDFVKIEDKIDSASLNTESECSETDESVLEEILLKQQQTYNVVEKLKEANDKLSKIPLPKKAGSEGLKTITFSETISVRSSTSSNSSNSSIYSAEIPSSKSPSSASQHLQKPIITIDQASETNSTCSSQKSLDKSNLDENIFSAADTTHSSLASLDESRLSGDKLANKFEDKFIENEIITDKNSNQSDSLHDNSLEKIDKDKVAESDNIDNRSIESIISAEFEKSVKKSENSYNVAEPVASISDNNCNRSISSIVSVENLVKKENLSIDDVKMAQQPEIIAESINSEISSLIELPDIADQTADEVESIKSFQSQNSSNSQNALNLNNRKKSIPKISDNQEGENCESDEGSSVAEQLKSPKIKAKPPPGPKRSNTNIKRRVKTDPNEPNVFDRLYNYSRCKSAPQIKEKRKGKYLWSDPDDQPKFVHELPNYMRPVTAYSEKSKSKRFEINFGQPSKFVRDHWKEIEEKNPGIKSRYSMSDEQKKQEAKRNRLRAERLKAHEKLIQQQKEEDLQSCHDIWATWYTNHIEQYREAERERIMKEKEEARNREIEEEINERETKKQVESWKKAKLLQQRREQNTQKIIQNQLDAEKESESDRRKRNNKAYKSWIKKVKKSEKDRLDMEKAMVKLMKIEMRREMRAKKALLVIRAAQEEALKYKGFVF